MAIFVVVVQLLSHVQLFHDPVDCSPPGSSVHGISHKNTGAGSLSLLQEIFSTQGSSLASLALQANSCISCNAGDPGLIPGSGRYPGEGIGNPLQYSGLGNPMDRETWWVAESDKTE